jgi:hypothetical protein
VTAAGFDLVNETDGGDGSRAAEEEWALATTGAG